MNCRLRKRLHRISPAQEAEGARRRQRSELISIELTYGMVWTPDVETEEARDLIRARLDAVAALKSTSTREYVFWAKSADLGGGHAKEASTSACRPSKRTMSGFGRCMWLAVTVSGAVARGATLCKSPIQV